MRPSINSEYNAMPLLFRGATPRTAADELPGHYDQHTCLWVVETTRGMVPLVELAAPAQMETSTSTRVRQEGDDEDFTGAEQFAAHLETSTLTKVRQESADDDLSTEEALGSIGRAAALADLETKSAHQQENDDEISASALLEMETRTLNNQEGIDEDWPMLALQTGTRAVGDDREDRLAH